MEFALIMPLLFFLIGAVFLAGLATWRQSAADYGIFVVGAGAGAYDHPVDARNAIYWQDIANNITIVQHPSSRQVVSGLRLRRTVTWMFGAAGEEQVSGTVVTRRWRFYPGPPRGRWE